MTERAATSHREFIQKDSVESRFVTNSAHSVATRQKGGKTKPVKASAADARKPTKANAAMHPVVVSEKVFCNEALQAAAFYADENVLIFNMEVCEALRLLASHHILANCIVTSPPFYGQRDYKVAGQIGLEEHPKDFIRKLVNAFTLCRPVLADNGSMWVNIGDTYWSGKGDDARDHGYLAGGTCREGNRCSQTLPGEHRETASGAVDILPRSPALEEHAHEITQTRYSRRHEVPTGARPYQRTARVIRGDHSALEQSVELVDISR